jgi:Family of unknown function (DUF5343)
LGCASFGATIAVKGEEQALADKTHPYISGAGGITAAVTQFRKNFPSTVNAETLKKLSIAPNNESYLLNILRFVGLIDADGKKTDSAGTVFSKHDDGEFQKGLEKVVKEAYSELFSLHDDAWGLDDNSLISFFRSADQTSAVVGKRQADTFQALAALAGHGEVATPSKTKPPKDPKAKNGKSPKTAPPAVKIKGAGNGGDGQRDFGLTVRIEVNLPQAADQETYDRIFRSIRENLLNAK